MSLGFEDVEETFSSMITIASILVLAGRAILTSIVPYSSDAGAAEEGGSSIVAVNVESEKQAHVIMKAEELIL